MKHAKKKHAPGVNFEADSADQSAPVEAVGFDYATVYAADEEKDSDALSHGRARGEAEAWLKERGLSDLQRVVVLARAFECKSTRTIAAEIGKSKSWVGQMLRRGSVRECLKHLLSSQPLPPAGGPPGLSQVVEMSREAVKEAKDAFLKEYPDGTVIVQHEPTLSDAMKHARAVLSNWPSGEAVDPGHLWFALQELGVSATASETETIIAMIAIRPGLLLGEPKFRQTLVKLLEAARYGSKTAAESARKSLQVLTRGRTGHRIPVPDAVLASQSLAIRVAFADLQEVWQSFRHDPIAARLEGLREQIGEEHKSFSDPELQSLLNAELLYASARLAQKATGITHKAFLRAWKCQAAGSG